MHITDPSPCIWSADCNVIAVLTFEMLCAPPVCPSHCVTLTLLHVPLVIPAADAHSLAPWTGLGHVILPGWTQLARTLYAYLSFPFVPGVLALKYLHSEHASQTSD